MVTFLILAQKKDVDTIYSIDFFFSHSFIFHTENVMQGGEDTGTLSHLNTSFVPSLRDFDLSNFVPNGGFAIPRKKYYMDYFPVCPKGQGFDPKIAKKIECCS